MIALNTRVSEELDESLTKSAKYLDRPKSYIVRKALESYLQELEEDREDYEDAVRILAKNEPTISLEEVTEKLGFSKKFGLVNE